MEVIYCPKSLTLSLTTRRSGGIKTVQKSITRSVKRTMLITLNRIDITLIKKYFIHTLILFRTLSRAFIIRFTRQKKSKKKKMVKVFSNHQKETH